MVRHTVAFKLKFDAGSQAEHDFFKAAKELARIPVVKNFECLRQISKKNDYDFGISMEFDSMADYDVYSSNSDHMQFVRDHWSTEVADYIEIDYVPYDEAE